MRSLKFLVLLVYLSSTSVFAMPKAAEHAGAPVTEGADMPRPRVGVKEPPTAIEKKAKPTPRQNSQKKTSSLVKR